MGCGICGTSGLLLLSISRIVLCTSVKCIMVGYSPNSDDYLVYNPVTRCVYNRRSVKFDEAWVPGLPVLGRLQTSTIDQPGDEYLLPQAPPASAAPGQDVLMHAQPGDVAVPSPQGSVPVTGLLPEVRDSSTTGMHNPAYWQVAAECGYLPAHPPCSWQAL